MLSPCPTDLSYRGLPVDLIADNWKKYPLLLIGELAQALPEALPFPESGIGAPSSLPINDFYILISTSSEKFESLISRLEATGLSSAQILLMLPPEVEFSHPQISFFGIVDQIDGECAEEFRARLLGKLEGQRQKLLCAALQQAAENGVARNFPDSELASALDACRIGHALASSYSLSPRSHCRVLRLCLERIPFTACPWANDVSLEKLIHETSLLLLDCTRRGTSFRDGLKEMSGALPFKARNDLLHHVESALGHLLGGRSHAA